MKLRGPIVSTLFVCSALLIFAAGARAAEEGSANSAAGATGIFKWINFAIVAGALIWVFIKVLPPTFRSNADKISSAITKAQVRAMLSRLRSCKTLSQRGQRSSSGGGILTKPQVSQPTAPAEPRQDPPVGLR